MENDNETSDRMDREEVCLLIKYKPKKIERIFFKNFNRLFLVVERSSWNKQQKLWRSGNCLNGDTEQSDTTFEKWQGS